jgi:hypothetical protein
MAKDKELREKVDHLIKVLINARVIGSYDIHLVFESDLKNYGWGYDLENITGEVADNTQAIRLLSKFLGVKIKYHEEKTCPGHYEIEKINKKKQKKGEKK